MDEEMMDIEYDEYDEAAEEKKKKKALTRREYYEEAMEDLKLIDVITQTRNVAGMYRKTARKLKKAKNYLDAPQKVEEFLEKALQLHEKGKEEIYQRACGLMESAQTEAEQRLAIDMFHRISGYRDADELAETYEKRTRRAARRTQIRNALMAIAVMMAVASFLILIR